MAALAEDVDLVGLTGGHVVVHELDGHRGWVALIEHQAAQVEQSRAADHLEQTLRGRGEVAARSSMRAGMRAGMRVAHHVRGEMPAR